MKIFFVLFLCIIFFQHGYAQDYNVMLIPDSLKTNANLINRYSELHYTIINDKKVNLYEKLVYTILNEAEVSMQITQLIMTSLLQ